MGYNMAGNMAKNTDNMLVWNRTRSVAERHAKEHGTNVMNLGLERIVTAASATFARSSCVYLQATKLILS